MTSIVKFTPLYGAHSEQPLCSLLEIDECLILLDCGWTDEFDPTLLKPLLKIAPRVEIVLLSHFDLAHAGALPYAMAHMGLTARVLCTLPVQKLAHLTFYEAYLSRTNFENFDTVTLDDIDTCIDAFIPLKYSQRHVYKGAGINLELTPFSAGHLLGGAVWQIKREADEIVYAVDFNHKNERHLGASMLETLEKSTLLIADSHNSFYQETARKQRDQTLIDTIIATLKSGGNVLLPVDSGRVLELLLLLDQLWPQAQALGAPLIFLANMAFNIVDAARGQLEWMNEAITRKFTQTRENPFNFKHVRLAHKLADLKSFASPRVILATQSDLTPGFALELFLQMASDPLSRVILTDRSRPGALSRRLLENPVPGALLLQRWLRVPLEGEELAAHVRQRDREKQAALDRKKAEEEMQRLKRERTELYDYEGEDVDQVASLSALWKGHDLYAERVRYEQAQKKDKAKRDPHLMYPFLERRSVYDDYGENLRVDELRKLAEGLQGAEDGGAPVDAMELEQLAPVEEEEEAPTKSVLVRTEVNVQCALQYIEFEGRSDGRALKKILPALQTRNLILIHGTSDSTSDLATSLKANTNPPRVLTPQNGETVDVTEATDLYRLHLKSALLESLKWADVDGSKVAFVHGVITVPPEEVDEQGQFRQPEPFLDGLPQGVAAGHVPTLVGDVKLSNFKQQLTDLGLRAEFKGGALLANNTVAIRRDPEARTVAAAMEVEGWLSDDYFKVRQALFGQYHLV